MYQAPMGQPIYTNFTIQKAVKEGLRSNVWVYKCINLIVQAAAAVPWMVEKDGEFVEGHYLNDLMKRPNPAISRQQLFEMLISWIQLAGNAYLKRVITGKRTVELWPISPDRLHPIPSRDIAEWIAGYALDTSTDIAFEPHEIIHLMAIQDPANPLIGISPLQAAGKIVDSDNAQQAFNVASMQNQGATSGVWTFERSFANQAEADAISQQLNERYAGVDNAKRMVVLGNNAKFQETQMTPKEMDFMESRKSNRNEIFLAFGVPPQLGGSEEASTYNNYQASELIFWNQTVIPLLSDIRDALNHSLYDELGDNERINFDTSNIGALRTALFDKSKVAETFAKIGVPFEQVNTKLEFGFIEYDGWDKSPNMQAQPAVSEPVRAQHRFTLDMETRSADTSAEIDEVATGELFSRFNKFFSDQKKAVFTDIEKNNGTGIRTIIESDAEDFKTLLLTAYSDVAGQFAAKVVVEKRDAADTAVTQIMGDLLKIVGVASGQINQTTIDTLQEQMTEGLENGWSMKEFQQAIIDTGVFAPSRALLISRTVATGAANLGQITGARETAATHKVWRTAGHEVRDSHQKMNNVTIPIDDLFHVGSDKAMYPGDNSLSAANRCNCRCSMNFLIQ